MYSISVKQCAGQSDLADARFFVFLHQYTEGDGDHVEYDGDCPYDKSFRFLFVCGHSAQANKFAISYADRHGISQGCTVLLNDTLEAQITRRHERALVHKEQ